MPFNEIEMLSEKIEVIQKVISNKSTSGVGIYFWELIAWVDEVDGKWEWRKFYPDEKDQIKLDFDEVWEKKRDSIYIQSNDCIDFIYKFIKNNKYQKYKK